MKKLIPILALLLLFACDNSSKTISDFNESSGALELYEEITPITRQEMAVAPPPPPSELQSSQNQNVNKKKIIKDGNINVKVKDIDVAKAQTDELVSKYGAYYSNESLENNDYESRYNLSIRIPSQNFELFITGVENGDGEITYKNISARDVTEEFIDLESRLLNKESYLKQYREILKRARTIKEILEVQEKIRRIEEEIESTQGRLKYLSDQVSYSTIHLTLTQKKEFVYTPQEKEKFFERLKQNFSKGWDGFVAFILFVIKLWPFWIICYGIWFIISKWRKKRKQKKSNA